MTVVDREDLAVERFGASMPARSVMGNRFLKQCVYRIHIGSRNSPWLNGELPGRYPETQEVAPVE